MQVYMQPKHTLSGMKKKTAGVFTYETIQATYAMWLWRRTAPNQGKQPIFLLSSSTFTAIKKCSLPVFLSTPQYWSGLLAPHHLPCPGYCINPLRPTIHIEILHIELHTFPYRASWENLKKDHSIFPQMIILSILITSSLDNVLVLWGENWPWSPLGFK